MNLGTSLSQSLRSRDGLRRVPEPSHDVLSRPARCHDALGRPGLSGDDFRRA